ncbi:hypothetical protein [Nevskia soli]|uniref:hypothetical protein n=1 Tax=Nevskia soli TaxID=418856 RepID=UPI000A07AE19|nr:hypothetical protein [Nevskia soli]
MKFVLHYRGPLRSNGNPAHKHDVRQAFHAQLKALWNQSPLNEYGEFLQPRKAPGNYSSLRPLGAFTFVPLVTAEINAVAELRLTLLRPEPPGQLITQGGDIDNRLKTLFDALTMPRLLNALPIGITPTQDQIPFFCLLEDDNLVTSVSVNTQQLLEPVSDTSLADVLVEVTTRVTRVTFGNGQFA